MACVVNFCRPAALLLVSAAVLLGGGAHAAAPTTDRAEVLKALIDCRSIPDAGARLACFDKAAAEIDKAEAGGDIVVVDRKQAQAARRQAFGFSLPTLAIFDKAATKGELNVIEAKVVSGAPGPDGRWVITLADGAVWHEIGDAEPNLDPRPGKTARISRGSLGTYFIKIDGVSTRVRREQ